MAMRYARHRTNGTDYATARSTSIVRAIRGELPPPAGTWWRLDKANSAAELRTTHPVFGSDTHALDVLGGSLTGLPDEQFEIAFEIGCPGGASTGVLFRSVSLSRPETFRYLAKGTLHVGDTSALAVLRIHDLSWIGGDLSGDDVRIMTIATSIDRPLWSSDEFVPAPWLTRSTAEVFLHTEWRAGAASLPALSEAPCFSNA